MTILQAIVLAIVQGATEFIPISSSGHLVLVRELFRWSDVGGIFVDTILHVASLLAILVYFREDWLKVIRAFRVSGVEGRGLGAESVEARGMLWILIAATLPAVLVGPFIETKMDALRSGGVIGVIMIITAGWFFLCERREGRNPIRIGYRVALFMGAVQVFALMPGASRSGLTIAAALLCGRKREDAARFSFLMAVPTIMGALLLEAGKVIQSPVGDLSPWVVLLGFVICFIVSLASITFCMRLFRRHSLAVFGTYLLILGAVLVVLRYASLALG